MFHLKQRRPKTHTPTRHRRTTTVIRGSGIPVVRFMFWKEDTQARTPVPSPETRRSRPARTASVLNRAFHTTTRTGMIIPDSRCSRSVQEGTTSLFALLWRARMTRHAHAASHVPSDTAGEHDTPTPVLVRPRGRAPTSESGVREHTPRSRCSSRTTRTRTKIKHTQMTTKAAFFGRIRLN